MNKPDDIQEFLGEGPCAVLCAGAFHKCTFLDVLVRSSDCGVIYLDFDMLYSGYVKAGVMECPDDVLLRRPRLQEWGDELTAILQMVSVRRHLVVVDSLNGMGCMWPDRYAARLANYSVMLMASLGKYAGTQVVAGAVAKREQDHWELTPGGQLPDMDSFVLEAGPPMSLLRGDGARLAL